MTNSRFEALEARCQKLRFKRYVKIFFFTLAFILLGWLVLNQKYLFLVFENNATTLETSTQYSDNNQSSAHTLEEANSTIEDKNESAEHNETNASLNTQDAFKLSLTINRERYPESTKKEPSQKIMEATSKNTSSPLQIQREFDLGAPEQAPKTFSMSVKSLDSEEALLKSHASAPTFKTTYDLAMFYFEKNDYAKAIKWSKDANKLDPASDKPWIVYAQSKYALMEREDAMKALEVFLQYVHSQEAKVLLEKYRGQK